MQIQSEKSPLYTALMPHQSAHISYIGADGWVNGGSLWIVEDQMHSIRIDCIQFESITQNTDWLRISCCATVFWLRLLSHGGRLRNFWKFQTNCSHSTAQCGLLRIVGNHGGLWWMDIHFTVDSYLQWNILLNRVCVAPALTLSRSSFDKR